MSILCGFSGLTGCGIESVPQSIIDFLFSAIVHPDVLCRIMGIGCTG